ncbi:hypothetical protein Taro_036811, partial [Colocasia esculenta]|nr:hypothetical protein [Colocasia esculenta]
GRGRGLAGASAGSSRLPTGQSEFVSSSRTGNSGARRWSQRPLFDPEGQIASLEGILHSTNRQRDDLQVVVTQLREELDQAQQMVGGASSSREDPGHSVLEGQLAATVARAEEGGSRRLS